MRGASGRWATPARAAAADHEALLEIVEAEGPMLAGRAYALYNRAAGGKKLTTSRGRRSPPRSTGSRARAASR